MSKQLKELLCVIFQYFLPLFISGWLIFERHDILLGILQAFGWLYNVWLGRKNEE